MSKFKHIGSATTTTLVSKSSGLTSINSATNRRGFNRIDIPKISITNFDTSSATVKVFLDGVTKAVRTVNQTTGTGSTVIFDQENVISRSDLIEVGDELVDGADATPHGVVTVVNTSGNTKQVTRTTSSEIDNDQTINFKKPDHYITGVINIPAGVILVLDESFSFNLYQHELKLTNTTTGTANLTIRID